MSARNTPPTSRSRSAFALWGWVMLLVVALSAIPTGGQLRTRLVGSAFDPTTVSVALSPKQPKAKKASLRNAARRDLFEPASGEPPVVLAASFAAPAPVSEGAAGIAEFPRRQFVATSRSLTRAHGARAPPLA